MVEKWLEAHIFFTDDQRNSISIVLQEVVKYCADELKSRNMRKTFHYLFEPRIDNKPGFEILFRAEAQENISLDEMERIVRERIDHFLHLIDGEQITKGYHGEASDSEFGPDGWQLTKQFLEVGSEIAIGRFSAAFRKGEKFHPGKLVHCFLNQQRVDEEKFHADALIGRVIITLHATSVTHEVESRAGNLLGEALNRLRSQQIRFL
ncbi:MAG: hypothetical protein FGF48_07225 [Candidatus Brockarchaeota archaeon]|nr:hypothetical protein [Candidatus Brockarchaeota archaeon]